MGGQDEVDRGVDLTRSDDPREGFPTQRGYARDIRVRADLTIFKWFRLSLDMGGTSGVANRAVAFFVVTCAAMIPAALGGAICLAARAPMAVTLLVCLAIGVASGAVALLPYLRRRHERPVGKSGRKRDRSRRRGRKAKRPPPKRAARSGKRRRNRRGPRR